MKKLVVVASGWHFPLHFFKSIAAQKVPEGWEVDLFCVSHRDPALAAADHADILANLGYSRRELYDRILYAEHASVAAIEALGWTYMLEPNDIGDMGNVNQWLKKHDYKQYDKMLITHDDNFILSDQMLLEVLPEEGWLIKSNSDGHAQRRIRSLLGMKKPFEIRGSFEFFTREMIDILGGSFDLSEVSLNREGVTESGRAFTDISDWNNTTVPLMNLIREKNLLPRITFLSETYRMSRHCLEGERGFIHKTEPSNEKEEDRGLDDVERYYASRAVRT